MKGNEPENKITHRGHTADDVTSPAQYPHLLLPHLALDLVGVRLCLGYLEPHTSTLSICLTRHHSHSDARGNTLCTGLQILASKRKFKT